MQTSGVVCSNFVVQYTTGALFVTRESYSQCNIGNDGQPLSEMSHGGKRHVRNGDIVRCPRTHFALVRNTHHS